MFKFIKKSKKILSLVVAIAVLAVFTSFNDDKDFKLAKNMEIFYDLVRDLNQYYVDDIDVEKIMNTGIKDMLKTLDPYTIYYPESRIEEFRLLTTGQYGGIGAMMRNQNGKIIIDEIFENYPSHKAGFKAGDIITKVEGKEANAKTYDDVSELIKGLPDSEVEISIYRPTENKHYTKRLVRERIIDKSVEHYDMVTDKIGYINLSRFSGDSYTQVKDAFLELKSKNADKLILDLRNNPGGLLIQSVKILSLFIDKATPVVSTKGKIKRSNNTYKTSNKPLDTEIPIVVLVNSNSASASEIVSGALQDLDRAVIIGERTYGKGLVQMTKDLNYNAKVKLTTAKYYIPSGRCIQALDYSHRNPDGSVGHIPDSLISEFKTVNGRTVYDGGGINPDIKIEKKGISEITKYLYENMIIFDFATNYAAKHQSIETAEKFSVSEQDFNDFVNFAISKNISYKTETDSLIKQLVKVTKNEGYYNKAQKEISALEKAVSHSVKEDILFFKPQIKNILNSEIVRRYYFKKGAIKNMLSNDKYINLAIKTLNTPNEYKKILNP